MKKLGRPVWLPVNPFAPLTLNQEFRLQRCLKRVPRVLEGGSTVLLMKLAV